MPEAYIYDAVRTPRGRGKKDGSLYDVTPVQLAAAALAAVRDRTGIDSALIDDVILGCVEPVGEQGAVIARTAVIVARYAESVAGMRQRIAESTLAESGRFLSYDGPEVPW